jgi:putative ABC transport system permease protein
MQDLRLAFRALRATPVVTAVAILSLALGIGANTAIFSIVNGLLLRNLPVRDPERLVLVTEGTMMRPRAWSFPVWEQIRRRPDLFERTAAWSFTRFNLAPGGETAFVDGLWVSGSFFDTLGVPAMLGRTFSDVDDRPGGGSDGPVAVISYAFWQRRFSGAADAVGRAIRLDNVTFTIVGVMSPDFFGADVGRTFDVAVPVADEPIVRGRDSAVNNEGTTFLTVIGRLRQDESQEAATAALRRAQPQIREATVGDIGQFGSRQAVERYLTTPMALLPAATGASDLRLRYERPLLTILVVAALVLLIACANIANLLLSRATARRHELSVRVALGASRWRVVRQFLTESLVLSGTGAAFGLLLAAWSSRLLVHMISTPANAVFLDVSIDGRVLAFTVVVAVATTLFCGSAPAFRTTGVAPIDALKEHGRTTVGQSRGTMTDWLVVAQVAMSLVLVVAAGLFVRTFLSLSGRPLGFQTGHVLVVSIDATRALADPAGRLPVYERTRDAVRALPDVADAALSLTTPAGNGQFTPRMQLAGGPAVDTQGPIWANLISPGWFSTFGTPLVAGRDLTDADRKGAPRVAVVNEAFVRKLVGGGSPIGRAFTLYPGTTRSLGPFEIVGVAADAVYTSPRNPMPPTFYLPLAQFDYLADLGIRTINLSIRARTGSPMTLTRSVAAAAATVNPQLALTFRPLADQIDASLTQERVVAMLAGFFGALALLLAGLGLYGVTSYAVSRRRAEIGIRMALGAAPAGVVRFVLARLTLLVAIGVAAGAGVSAWASRFVATLLYGLEPRDPVTLAGAALVLGAVGALAGSLPACRASRVDPAEVLRQS